MRRTLVLKKETLTELAAAELAGVAGGQATPTCPTFECTELTSYCESANYTCLVSRRMDPCLTYPCQQ